MSDGQGRARGSTLVAAGILLSRVAGVIRLQVLGIVLGGGPVTDAFAFAQRLPNLLQNLLGEGSLSASFIPVYARMIEEGREEEADDLAGAVVALLTIITAVIVVLGLVLARPLVWLFTSWENDPQQYDLATNLTRITTVGIGFLVISAWCLGILNSHRSFFLSYVAPVVWNAAQIIALVLFGLLLAWDVDDIAVAVAWAVVIGAVGQVLIQLPKVRRLAPSVRPNLTSTAALRDVVGRFAPAVGARGVVQISSYADLALAGLLVFGALSWYTFALPLYLLPISLFGFSVAAAELAEMSRSTGGAEAVAARLTPALRQVLVPAGFVTALFFAAGRPVVDGLYGWLSRLLDRGFTDPEITTIGLVLTAFALGLPATMTARVTQNTLYSLGDVRGPARIAVLRLAVSVSVGLILILQLDWLSFDAAGNVTAFGDVPHWPPWERVPEARRLDRGAPPHLGVVGLAVGAATASWVEWFALRRRLRSHLGVPVRSGWARPVAVATVASAAVMALIDRLGVPSPIDAAIIGAVGAAVYGGALVSQGVRPAIGRRSGGSSD